jgi:DNA-binding response OmpR family regulator
MRSDSTQKEVLKMGAKAFITKPFKPDMFLTVVKTTLEEPDAV